MRARNIVVLGGLLLLTISAGCVACVGARPLSMGGAFIGLADDANATYWNPAGIARMTKPQATAMYTATNRDEINYQDYEAYAGSIPTKGIGYGISHVSDRFYDAGINPYYDGEDDQDWIWLSGAYKVAPNTYAGVNVRFINDSMTDASTDTGIDLSFLKIVDQKWSYGLLIQDFNEPETFLMAGSLRHARNIRPGVAYRQDKNTIITADIYDFLDHSDSLALRLGYEHKLKSGMALRAGYYGAGSSGGLTFGAGGKVGRMQFDAALMTGDLDNTLLLSATSSF